MTEVAGRRRLSILRVFLALVVLAGLAAGGFELAKRRMDRPDPPAVVNDPIQATWFAPYVDVTATPTYQFQDPGYDLARQVVLGFVVASPTAPCTPSWGGSYTPGQAAVALDLDRRVVQYRERGDSVVVSFGGSAGQELAITCLSEPALVDAYLYVIRRYDVSTVDFDLEGVELSDTAALHRRAAALAQVQRQLAAAGAHLGVWLTLPASRGGLSPAGHAAVSAMLAARVDLAGVDLLAMDFGSSGHPGNNVLDAVEASLSAAHGQLTAIFVAAGLLLDSEQVWNRLGVTVMIGQNDMAGEQFSVADAPQLATFARQEHLARVSMWSLNRDSPCGTYYAEQGVLSDFCSGATESDLGFSSGFAALKGSISDPPTTFPPLAGDDAATAPYPIWEPQETYQAGYKVVWQGDVYQAKWSSTGTAPDTPVQYSYQTPWLLVGPVLPTDHAPTVTTLPAGTYQKWSPTKGYSAGSKVLVNGLPYQAKWYSLGDQPGADPADPAASPWEPLFTVPGEPAGSS